MCKKTLREINVFLLAYSVFGFFEFETEELVLIGFGGTVFVAAEPKLRTMEITLFEAFEYLTATDMPISCLQKASEFLEETEASSSIWGKVLNNDSFTLL